jgi:hypothetical protein
MKLIHEIIMLRSNVMCVLRFVLYGEDWSLKIDKKCRNTKHLITKTAGIIMVMQLSKNQLLHMGYTRKKFTLSGTE